MFLKELFQKNASTLLSMFLLVALPLLGSSSLTILLYRHQALLQHLSNWQSILYFIVIAFTMAFAFTPTTFVALVTGFYFGWSGLPGMVAAYALAAAVGYRIATSLDHGKMLAFLSHFPKADAVMRELKHESWQLILLTRISPVLPFALMTFVLAVMRVNPRRFLLASVVGMLPRSLFFYWLGTKAQDVFALVRNPDTGTAGKLLLLGLVVVSLFGLYYVFNQALKRALGRSATEQHKKN
ncbi:MULTISPECIES: TVP38/TMEM64 family protein [Hymenobacter]|uniref:TVP38/TMEM64 family membrane protein n=1 Tax=Hymenobacter jejuensis TaxID=2502781 RepID=A0A5B8A0G1_9BACT|nr:MULTISPECIES: VTT domain-containing protein [Hymenobacter]MBC6990679.1 TVP38/TMEM64 family protein [Hymenobacter sp. BT491]QDA60914.1 TVP38/TMEM64 family protein [Hymenobacter jejuensis]